ncbi:MAG: hypothetical protein PHI31_17015 [Desulfuromonadaceae bacterium]|nr:hypothetical protein [Desulfuromonadaceae bacterium]
MRHQRRDRQHDTVYKQQQRSPQTGADGNPRQVGGADAAGHHGINKGEYLLGQLGGQDRGRQGQEGTSFSFKKPDPITAGLCEIHITSK